MIKLLTDDHYENIMDLFDSTEKSIKIVSPFLSMNMAKKLCSVVKQNNISCRFITRLYLEDMFSKANDLDALKLMIESGIEVLTVKGLHTKLYIFDDIKSVVGSANFTSGGFISNIELSLLAEDEPELLKSLRDYYEKLSSQILSKAEGVLMLEQLDKAKSLYLKLLESKKQSNAATTSSYMYGAVIDYKDYSKTTVLQKEMEICKNDHDIMTRVFKDNREEIIFDHNIWLKFDGEGSNRIDSDTRFPIIQANLNGKNVFVQNYSFKVGSIKAGDEVYLAAITQSAGGKNEPVIMGRGYMRKFESGNEVGGEWLKEYSWMSKYPYFCVMDRVSILDTGVKNGVPLSEVLDKFGSDTYKASFGRNESYQAVSKKHHQKAHIRLSGNAKIYIDSRLDELEKKYGIIVYESEK